MLVAGLIYASLQRNNNLEVDEPRLSAREYLLSNFLSELPNINSKLPYQVDAETVLISVEYTNNRILSQYKLLNHKSITEINQKGAAKLTEILKQQGCTDETKKSLINVGVEFLSRYQDSEGLVIFEVFLNKSICSTLISDE